MISYLYVIFWGMISYHIFHLLIYTTGGLDMVMKYYVKLYAKILKNIIEPKQMKINTKFLNTLLICFSKVEDYYFKQVLPKYKDNANNKPKICKSDDLYDIDIWMVDNMIGLKNTDKINLGEDMQCEYKSRYYSYYYESGEYEDSLIDDMCKEYFNGLIWTLKYYLINVHHGNGSIHILQVPLYQICVFMQKIMILIL